MSKSNTNEANDSAEVTEVTTVGSKMIKPVTMSTGEVVDFGKRGQILKVVETTPGIGFRTIFKLITGKVVELALTRDSAIYDILAARGAAEYIGNAVAGVYQDKEGIHPEDFDLGIEQAIAQLLSGDLATRKTSEDLKGYGDLIRALVILRSRAVLEDGTPRFTEEEASYEACKVQIMSSDAATNKSRRLQPAFIQLLEQFKVERAQARADKASKAVSVAVDELL